MELRFDNWKEIIKKIVNIKIKTSLLSIFIFHKIDQQNICSNWLTYITNVNTNT